jgi:tripartite-type tricarboxylate transporter receptor subunit TctC
LARRRASVLACAAGATILAACGDRPASGSRHSAPGTARIEAAGAGAGSDTPPGAESRRAVEAFYRGKTVSVIVGSGAGGGFDTTARIVSRHISRHIPGAPTVIVVNMPGGAGLLAVNHLFNAAPRDGTVLGIFSELHVMNQLTGSAGVQFDLRKFNWLGSSYSDPNVCLIRTDAPITDFRSMIGNPTAIAVGATGPGSSTFDSPRILAAATGANVKTVSGYTTTNDVRVGIERGEINGMCLNLQSMQTASSQWLADRYAQVFVQNGLTPHHDLPDVPLALSFARDDESRMLLRLMDAPSAMAKPFVMPPDVDPALVHAMREALQSTYRDPAFVKEAQAMKLDFQPKTAAEILRILDEVLSTPPNVAAKYRQIVEP